MDFRVQENLDSEVLNPMARSASIAHSRGIEKRLFLLALVLFFLLAGAVIGLKA